MVEGEGVRTKAGLPGQGKVEERMRCGDVAADLWHYFVSLEWPSAGKARQTRSLPPLKTLKTSSSSPFRKPAARYSLSPCIPAAFTIAPPHVFVLVRIAKIGVIT